MAQEMAQLRQLLGLRSVAHLQSQAMGTTLRGGHHTRLQSCGQLDLHRLQSMVDFSSERRPQRTPDSRALFNLVGPDFEEGPNSLSGKKSFMTRSMRNRIRSNATTVGILTNLAHTIEMMQQHEEQWRRRLEREVEKRRRMEENTTCNGPRNGATPTAARSPIGRPFTISSDGNHTPRWPPYSVAKLRSARFASFASVLILKKVQTPPIREEEFYDAIDAESDKIEQDAARLAALRSVGKLLRSAQAMPPTHPLHT
ncbi:hypothetical protein AHF37_10584, partial [Paragonimus kellicotti]